MVRANCIGEVAKGAEGGVVSRVYTMVLAMVSFMCLPAPMMQVHHYYEQKDLLYGNATMVEMIDPHRLQEVIKLNTSLILFSSRGCKDCFEIEHHIIGLAESHHGDNAHKMAHQHHRIPTFGIDVRIYPEVMKTHRVQRLPTVRIYHRGLYRTVPESLHSRSRVEQFIHQRIHLHRLPEIHNQARLEEVISEVPHVLIAYTDDLHKKDEAEKQLLRYLQFSLTHFHFYVIHRKELADRYNLTLHGLYEINQDTKIFKKIPYEDLIIWHKNHTHIDFDHLDKLKRRIYEAAHHRIQMLDLVHFEKFGLHDMLVFYSKDTTKNISENKLMKLFNESCHTHLFYHTRCSIFNSNVSRDVDYLDGIFHVPLERLSANTIIHFRMHHFKRETFVLEPEQYSTKEGIVDFYHKTQHHEWPEFVEMSEPIPDNTNAKIHKIVALTAWKYFEHKQDLLILMFNSSDVDPEHLNIVKSRFEFARDFLHKHRPKYDLLFATYDTAKNKNSYLFEHKNAILMMRHYEGPGQGIDLDSTDLSTLAQKIVFMVESCNSYVHHEHIWPLKYPTTDGVFYTDEEVMRGEHVADHERMMAEQMGQDL